MYIPRLQYIDNYTVNEPPQFWIYIANFEIPALMKYSSKAYFYSTHVLFLCQRVSTYETSSSIYTETMGQPHVQATMTV